MANRLGMDVDLIRSYADQIDQTAGTLQAIISSANACVSRLNEAWLGHDAEDLEQRWQYQHRPALDTLLTAVHQLAASARAEAAQQVQTSGGIESVGLTAGASMSESPFSVSDFLELMGSLNAVLGGGTTALLLAEEKLGVTNLTWKTLLPEWSKVSRAVDEGSGDLGKYLGAAGLLVDLASFANDEAGGADGLRLTWDAVNFGIDVVGVMIPEVALAKGAFDLGLLAGSYIAKIPAVQHGIDQIQDGAISAGERAVGADSATTPAEADAAAGRLVDRYSGPMGPMRAAKDVASNTERSAVDFVASHL